MDSDEEDFEGHPLQCFSCVIRSTSTKSGAVRAPRAVRNRLAELIDNCSSSTSSSGQLQPVSTGDPALPKLKPTGARPRYSRRSKTTTSFPDLVSADSSVSGSFRGKSCASSSQGTTTPAAGDNASAGSRSYASTPGTYRLFGWKSGQAATSTQANASSRRGTKSAGAQKRQSGRVSWEAGNRAAFKHSARDALSPLKEKRRIRSAGASSGSRSTTSLSPAQEDVERLMEVKEKVTKAERQAQAAESELLKLLEAVHEKEKEVEEVVAALQATKERMRLAQEQAEMLRLADSLAGEERPAPEAAEAAPKSAPSPSGSFTAEELECLELLEAVCAPERPLLRSQSMEREAQCVETQVEREAQSVEGDAQAGLSEQWEHASAGARLSSGQEGPEHPGRAAGQGAGRGESGGERRSSMQAQVEEGRRRLCLSVWDVEEQLRAAQEQLGHLDLAAGDARTRMVVPGVAVGGQPVETQ